MTALSFMQPWPWAIVHFTKRIENRSWYTTRRGFFLIHASKRFDHEGYEWIKWKFPHIDLPPVRELPRGGIVGSACLQNVVRAHPSPWFVGPWGWVLEDVKALPFKPCKGKLGFFHV